MITIGQNVPCPTIKDIRYIDDYQHPGNMLPKNLAAHVIMANLGVTWDHPICRCGHGEMVHVQADPGDQELVFLPCYACACFDYSVR